MMFYYCNCNYSKQYHNILRCHRSKNRSKRILGRSVPVKIVTDVEADGTSEDGSPRPLCSIVTFPNINIPANKYSLNVT